MSSSQEGKAAEVSNARDRLSGALSHAVDRFGGSEEAGIHGIFGSPSKRLHDMDSPLTSPSKSPRVVRRRRKKEPNPASEFHHTFVMKLFDRSVDLAQFPERTSLYPVCRAWMKNEPHNTNMAPRLRTPTPEPRGFQTEPDKADDDDDDEEEREVGGDGDGDDEIAKMVQEKEDETVHHVYKMPPFQPLEMDAHGRDASLRIPSPSSSPSPPPPSDDKDFLLWPKPKTRRCSLPPPSKESLFNDHMVKWMRVRRRWRGAAARNEERYRESVDLLRDMFER